METLLDLLREFGASDELIALAERFIRRDDEGVAVLTDDELTSLLTQLVALADDDDAGPELLGAAADAACAIRDDQSARVEAAEEEERRVSAERARLRGETVDQDDDEDDEDGDDGDGAEVVPDVEPEPVEAEAGGEVEPEPVTAAGGRRPAARRQHRPPSRGAAPAVDDTGQSYAVFAADVPGAPAGGITRNRADVDRALMRRWEAFRRMPQRRNGDGAEELLPVATIRGHLPEDRMLVDADGQPLGAAVVTSRIEAALQSLNIDNPAALVAAGGLCAVPTPLYSVEVLGDDRQPIRDEALVTFGAARGAVISMAPPRLVQLMTSTTVWDMDDDVDALAGSPTKPAVRIECGTTRTTEIEGFVTRLLFGNVIDRTYGEWVRAWTQLANTARARITEQRRFAQIVAKSTAITAETTDVSAVPDTLAYLDRAAAGIRSRHRTLDSFPMRVILPSLWRTIARTDLARSLPGAEPTANFTLADNLINSWFSSRDLNVTWSPDLNVIGNQGATTLAHLPPTVSWALFPEGTFINLDAGELDLGVVRDSGLNEVNDFETFFESFEAVHMLGVESYAGTLNVCPSGGRVGTLDPAAFCASYT